MRLRKLSFLVLVCVSAGCASIFNPYDSEFQCPETEKGKCLSVHSAYKESVRAPAANPAFGEKEKDPRSQRGEKGQEEPPQKVYEKALFHELTGLIEDPRTPMVAPPRVVRVLLLPYEGENNELFMLRYIYFFVDQQKWILGDYLHQPRR